MLFAQTGYHALMRFVVMYIGDGGVLLHQARQALRDFLLVGLVFGVHGHGQTGLVKHHAGQCDRPGGSA